MTKEELKDYVEKTFAGKATLLESGKFDLLFQIAPADLLEFAGAIKADPQLQLDYLCCLTGIDTGEHFEVHYAVTSITTHLRLDFKLVLPYDGAEIESVQSVWPAANWFEREIWELYGVDILNHGNLKQFLLPDDWDQGHPMRKDWDAPDFIRMPEV